MIKIALIKIRNRTLFGMAIGTSLTLGWFSHVGVIYLGDLQVKAAYYDQLNDRLTDQIKPLSTNQKKENQTNDKNPPAHK